MTVFVGPSGRVHNAGGQRGWSLWRSHTGGTNNEHTLFSQWAGSALQTIGPSLSSSTMSDNDHIQQHPASASLLTYMSINCDSHDELQEVRAGYDGASVCWHMLHVSCSGCLIPSKKNQLLAFYMLCCKKVSGTSTDLHQNMNKIQFGFCACVRACVRAAGTCCLPSLLSQRQADTVDPPVWAEGQSINMSCVLHYFQMSEAVSPIVRAFSPAFCHLSPILGPRGHVKIESDSQSSMLNRLIGQSCHGPDQSSLTPVAVRGSLCLNIQPVCVHFKKHQRKEKEWGKGKNRMWVFPKRLPEVESVLIQVAINTCN